jgi:hypothetical protein
MGTIHKGMVQIGKYMSAIKKIGAGIKKNCHCIENVPVQLHKWVRLEKSMSTVHE